MTDNEELRLYPREDCPFCGGEHEYITMRHRSGAVQKIMACEKVPHQNRLWSVDMSGFKKALADHYRRVMENGALD